MDEADWTSHLSINSHFSPPRDSQSREVSALRTRNIEIEAEVDRLKRQLTNERFERERALQELRRHGLAAPVETGRLSRLSAGSPTSAARLGAGSPSRLVFWAWVPNILLSWRQATPVETGRLSRLSAGSPTAAARLSAGSPSRYGESLCAGKAFCKQNDT